MPRESFQQELATLQRDVSTFGDAVSVRLRRAVTAIERRDKALAGTVVDGDDAINERYVELERACIDLFALQQPVASDLRVVASTYKLLTDLERVADLARNLAGWVVSADTTIVPAADLVELGDLVVSQFDDAMDAYAHDDTDLCYEIAERDDEVDRLSERVAEDVMRELAATKATRTDPETLLSEVRRLLLTVRDLERVGDHAVNVAARTLYLLEFDDELLY
jgi:phosphate transport system protein